MKLNNKGFTSVEIFVVVLVVAAIGSTGWFVYKGQKKDEAKSSNITSFEECKAAGKPIMESYPEQCNANGQTFVNEAQKAQAGSEESNKEYLEIPEFDVRLKVTEELSDIYYVKSSEPHKLFFSLKSFKGLGGASCATDLVHNLALIQTTYEDALSDPFIGGEDRMDELVKVADKYYHVPHGGSTCSTEPSFMSKAKAFDSSFRSAVKQNLEPLN